VSYHSNYDTLAWYRKIVGDDYASARLVTGIAAAMLAELADGGRPHVSAVELVADSIVQCERLRKDASDRGLATEAIDAVLAEARACAPSAAAADARVASRPRPGDAEELASLVGLWVRPEGLPGRPWFRNLFAATDRHSGYATSSWPLLREVIEDASPGAADAPRALEDAASVYLKAMRDLRFRLERLAQGA
jgi:N-acetylated-alpha-linked acidic dipeptidase